MVGEDLKFKTISKLPKLTSLLFPDEYELLSNTSELFELEESDCKRIELLL